VQVLLVFLIFLIGVWASGRQETIVGRRDPAIIVVDEAAGMWLSLLGAPQVLWQFVVALALFRFFDIIKPGPVNRLQNLPGGWGVMLDDIAAGSLTLAIMLLIRIAL